MLSGRGGRGGRGGWGGMLDIVSYREPPPLCGCADRTNTAVDIQQTSHFWRFLLVKPK